MRSALSVLALLALAAPTLAHHSRAAYNTDEFSELEGVLVDVTWRNPHIVFTLKATDDQGQDVLWRMEAGSIYMLERGGLTQELFSSGANVRVGGHVSRGGEADFLATNMLLSADREVLTMPNAAPRWTNQLTGARDNWIADDERLQGDSEAGLFQTWSVPREEARTFHEAFTDVALAARESWDPLNTFNVRCEPPGMPDVADGSHPVQFVDNGEELVIRQEEFDIVRTIHVENAVDPETQEPSRLGYSVGVWQGETLVVETTRINWPWYDRIGTPQSDAVHVRETYSSSSDGNRLDFSVTVTDPATLTEPARIEGHMLALGESVEPYNCEVF